MVSAENKIHLYLMAEESDSSPPECLQQCPEYPRIPLDAPDRTAGALLTSRLQAFVRPFLAYSNQSTRTLMKRGSSAL